MAAEFVRVLQELRTTSLAYALTHQLKYINLVAVKNIRYSFNPFCSNVESIRNMMFQLSVPKRRATNPMCALKTFVRSERCEPEMTVTFSDGHKALFKTANLNTVEICAEFNKLCRLHEEKQTAKKT